MTPDPGTRMSKKKTAKTSAATSSSPNLPRPDPPTGLTSPTSVGVGASAGGLEAFSQLLRALPERPGLALVFVQHMAPHHESALPSLLATSTGLNVLQPAADVRIEADHVYVIPPNRGLAMRDGSLIIQPRPTDRSQHYPIDSFFQSLAISHGEEAVAVVLSGTGTDGVEGVHAIKAAGGTAFVQSPDSAKQPGMPQAAIGTGKIDQVLSPAELGEELARLARERHGRLTHAPKSGQPPPLDPDQLERVFALLRGHSGVDFGQYKLPTVQRRIQRRMAMHKLGALDQY